jgi:hydrogenase maturation protein HypF
MTSGNRCGEPIVADNRAAVAKLGKIADTLLTHDRSIWNRCDDSVGYVEQQRLVLVRRSRGFVPLPVELPQEVKPSLALGAMSNNTFALAAGRRAYLSQHIGDVDNLEALGFLRESIEKFRQWLDIEPELVAHDLHPDLMTTHLAYELAEGRRTVAVQHHHAHFAAALTAAGITGQAQGLVFDGTGWGSDRTIWGGELLVGSVGLVKRAAHLRPLPLPGGEATVRRPLRMAVAGLHFLVPEAADAPLDLWRRAEPEEVSVVRRMVDRRFNTPPTSSAGRLFDAVAAMLGVCDEVTYEGQAAVELEQLARRGRARRGPALRLKITEQEKEIVLDPEPLLSGLVDALLNGARREDLAAGFHKALAVSIGSACSRVREGGGPVTVVLCGGVFQNRVLTRLTARVLESVGLRPVLPGTIPVNDGGVSLGQILVSNSGGNADGTLREGMVATCA